MNKLSQALNYLIGRVTVKSTTPTFSSGWGNYSGQNVTIKRCGALVIIAGAATNTEAKAPGADGIVFATIPSGYRPSQRVGTLCQGTGANKWLLEAFPNGNLRCARYGTTAADTKIAAGTWLPFCLAYFAE